jgi:hypothetical protein
MEKGGVTLKLCVCFGKILVIFPHFFHANAETVPKARHNRFLPIFYCIVYQVFYIEAINSEQEIVSDPLPSITLFLDT